MFIALIVMKSMRFKNRMITNTRMGKEVVMDLSQDTQRRIHGSIMAEINDLEEVVMEYKMCPILNINNTNASDMRISAKDGLVYCLEKECAWWDEANDCCIVQALSRLGGR